MGNWFNSDGLYLEFGTDKATPTTGGEYVTTGQLREIQFDLTLSTLTTSPAIPNVVDTTFVPKNVRIEEVELVVTTAATGATAVLNIGLMSTDRSTVVAAGGFVNALALTAIDAAGEKTVLRVGSTGAGTLIGTTIANPGHICADFDTAAFTAGVISVRIRYYTP